jgi:glutamyl-tRNA reductase
VANRTYNRAVCLARDLEGSAIHFDRLAEAMYDADVVISATGAPHTILTAEKVEAAVPHENLENMVMVDIANPRDIDEDVAQLGVKLYNIDDLRGVADRNRKMRESEAKKAEEIIGEELNLLEKSLRHLEVEPLIAQLRTQAEIIRQRETNKALHMLGDINGKEKVVADLSKVMVDRMFADIIHNLKEAAENEDKEVLKAASIIFRNKS